jgi:hypothetical protein
MTASTWIGRSGLVVALLSCAAARAQIVQQGIGREGLVTETVSLVDAWDDGPIGPDADGLKDVMTRVERRKTDTEETSVHLLLFGPWGQHGYGFTETAILPAPAISTGKRTAWRAIDLDGDGAKEIVLIERFVETRRATDAQGEPIQDDGPFFSDHRVAVRYLAREAGALVEHDLDMDPAAGPTKVLLAMELGGALDALLNLAAADAEFAKQGYAAAAYRYGVVREWAEAQLLPKEIEQLSPAMALPRPDPDLPEMLWLAATRRIGSLPRWYQKHG